MKLPGVELIIYSPIVPYLWSNITKVIALNPTWLSNYIFTVQTNENSEHENVSH